VALSSEATRPLLAPSVRSAFRSSQSSAASICGSVRSLRRASAVAALSSLVQICRDGGVRGRSGVCRGFEGVLSVSPDPARHWVNRAVTAGDACSRGGVQELLHLGFWFQRGLLMPRGDGSYGNSEVLGERLVAQPESGLQRTRGTACPDAHRAHRRVHAFRGMCTESALVVHSMCIGSAWDARWFRS
jgi:hypothetical protein